MVGGNNSQPRTKLSGGRSGRGGRLQNGSGSRGQSSRNSSLRKYEKKRSAEDLLVQKSKKGSTAAASREPSHGKGAKRESSWLKSLKRQFSCFAPEVTFELDQEASNACKLLSCKFFVFSLFAINIQLALPLFLLL